MIVDGWYRAQSARAVCGLHVRDGKVVVAAPYIRAWVMGKPAATAIAELKRKGFVVMRM